MTIEALDRLKGWLQEHKDRLGKVVDFDPVDDQVCDLDFTAANKDLTDNILDDVAQFSDWVEKKLTNSRCLYGIGGYNEHRTIYRQLTHFDKGEEPRRLHLGLDIWGEAGTPVYNFYQGRIHSFQDNAGFGDYGATIIMEYELDDLVIYVLYGHLSLASLAGLTEGQLIPAGQQFAFFGTPQENGHWPPHLHFQLIWDMEGKKGDYPGVCQFSNREVFLANCPDPAIILEYTFNNPSKIS